MISIINTTNTSNESDMRNTTNSSNSTEQLSSTVTGMTSLGQNTVKYMVGPTLLLFAASNPAGAMVLDRFIADAFYQFQLGGHTVYEPEYMLEKLSDIRMLPFDLGDYIKRVSRELETGIRSLKMIDTDIYYGLISNLGYDSIIYTCICIICPLILLVHIIWKKKIDKVLSPQTIKVDGEESIPNDHKDNNIGKTTEVIGDMNRTTIVRGTKCWYKWVDALLNFMKSTFGMNFMLIKMMGNQLEMISYYYLNIVHSENNKWMVMGLVMSGWGLVVYGAIGYYLLRGAIDGYRIVFGDKSINKVGVNQDRGSIM